MSKFRSFISEALQPPPHMPHKYYMDHQKYFADIKKYVAALDFTNTYWVKDFISSQDFYKFEDAVHAMERVASEIERGYYDPSMTIEVMFMKGSDVNRYLQRLTDVPESILNSLEWLNQNGDEVMAVIETAIAAVDDQRQYMGEDEIPPYEVGRKILLTMADALKRFRQYSQVTNEFVVRTKAMVERQTMHAATYMSGEKGKPASDAVETLYHTTTNMSAILQGGFKTRRELGVAALGGGPDDMISFTGDLQIAEAIVWSLRRAVEIAQGKIGYDGLMKIIQHYGVDPKQVADFATSQVGGFEAIKRGMFDSQGTTPTTPEQKAEWLFMAFKAFLSFQDKIYNPVFAFVQAKDLKGVNPLDIGIIAADVEIARTEYLIAMEEYRAPIDAISNVRRASYRGVNLPNLKVS